MLTEMDKRRIDCVKRVWRQSQIGNAAAVLAQDVDAAKPRLDGNAGNTGMVTVYSELFPAKMRQCE
jgi:hypothetical protein